MNAFTWMFQPIRCEQIFEYDSSAYDAPPTMTDPLQPTHRTVAVLDMGASAIRLVIGDVGPDRSIRVIDEASRGVLHRRCADG
jgi:hypothetical protein